ncbi:MAG: MAPEG family protein [Alphaproteobacteria bacterium]|nr:MAPEG family protein [Alphaproteobacteria bacterium]
MAYTTALYLFALLTLLMLNVEIMFTYATQGFGFGFSSNRNPAAEFSPLAVRIKRAYQNQIESAAYGVPVLAAAALTDLQSPSAETAAMLFVLGRALFTVLYYTGIPMARLIGFGMGALSIFYIIYALAM